VATDLPLAWTVQSAKRSEHNFALPLIDKTKARGFDIRTAIMDKGYDSDGLHWWLMRRGIAPVIPIKETAPVQRGAAEARRTARTESGRSREPTTSGELPSGAVRPASASPVRCGAKPAACTR
jgi:hypothetical protein